MKNKIRSFIWRILGFDYQLLLKKTDFTLLRDDQYTSINKNTYDNGAKVWRWTQAKLIIGKYCSIANNVNFIIDDGHHTQSLITNYPLHKRIDQDIETTANKLPFQKEGITVGNDVWIGMGSYIMPGVTIGNGVVIAANSVVTKDVKDYHIVGGAPAKTIKVKHDEDTIKKLNMISWWNWDDEKVKNSLSDFYNSIDSFLLKHTK